MKTRIKWIIALVAVVVGVVWLLGDRARAEIQDAPADGDRVAELEKEVQALRDTVARLEQRLTAVEQRGIRRVFELPEGVVPQGFEFTPELSWKQKLRPQGEINGVPYYVIPLKDRPAMTQPAVVPPPADGQP